MDLLLNLAYIGLAMLLGGLIGTEREFAGKPAGLRTHILVASGVALLVGLADVVINHFSTDLTGNIIRTDPIRIIEAVITGVSFLGAGTIIQYGQERSVEGLTTAASLLVTAAIAICVAMTQVALAIGVTIMTVVMLKGGAYFEEWMKQRMEESKILLSKAEQT